MKTNLEKSNFVVTLPLKLLVLLATVLYMKTHIFEWK